MNVQRPVKRPVKGSDRVRAFRARQKAKGLKLKQFWVPDLNDPAVQAQIREGIASLNADDERETMAWIEAVSADMWADEDAPE